MERCRIQSDLWDGCRTVPVTVGTGAAVSAVAGPAGPGRALAWEHACMVQDSSPVETRPSYADERGSLTVVSGTGTVTYVEVVTFAAAGVVRGNHYHRGYHERGYVQSGEIEARLVPLAGSASPGGVFRLVAGQLIDIPPMTLHVFTSVEPSVAICFGSGTSPVEDKHYLREPGPGLSS
ncbi:cupin domain-containing protein [Motilibacter aurantiacus]|uniref:cupin domain-containing protein n=1 Tax=Motilibacter aurantiacus TaxID=2714955 RepID=UPI001409286C|nr:cupin domain-containing protein [Motilibacter aurantiacus]NHC46381.1 hypothetical protein [Motilibacter aurantiacus]